MRMRCCNKRLVVRTTHARTQHAHDSKPFGHVQWMSRAELEEELQSRGVFDYVGEKDELQVWQHSPAVLNADTLLGLRSLMAGGCTCALRIPDRC
jgi:hypothetical protein